VLLILSIADAAASLVGLRYGRLRFSGKSVAGSGSFFLCALGILWIVLPAPAGVLVGGAAFATVVEAVPSAKLGPFELNDNLMVPVLTGLFLSLLMARVGPV
jgi:dolichol kinase